MASSGFTCHTAPSLRLFVSNSLTVYHRSLLSELPARDVTSLGCSGFPPFFRGVRSPTTTTAPSLRALVPSGTLIRLSLYRWGPVLLRYWLPFYSPFLFPFRRGSTFAQGPIPRSSFPTWNSECSLPELQSDGFPEDLVTLSHTFHSWLLSSDQSSGTVCGFPPFPQM
jgi:hypothetical protein